MKTTTREVTTQIRQHILEYFGPEVYGNDSSAGENLISQLEYMKNYPESLYQTAIRLVEGGSFLVYYGDIQEFLNDLGINPEHKEYTEQQSWDLYKHLLAREINKVYSWAK